MIRQSVWSLLLVGCVFAQHETMVESVPELNASNTEMSYALYPGHKLYFYLHVSLMVVSFWVMMPMGIMLGIARHSLHVPVQLLGFGFALMGFLFAKLYGHSTPHLYQGNSHHTLGWILLWILMIQMAAGFLRKWTKRDHYYPLRAEDAERRPSDTSGEETLHEFGAQAGLPKPSFGWWPYASRWTACSGYLHQILGRALFLLIFTQTVSGLVVYHGVCRSWEVLGCIAHLIKGGLFFFYGLVSFGRYLGAFADRGWAWNASSGGPSFEMIECGLIFLYGVTNTWMEHFGQDAAWTHKDLEHASLALMWWWCGLAGMLVESGRIRRVLGLDPETSLNPFPALTVFMTGVSMGNHHQETAYSTQIHWLWGLLLSSAAVCRLGTYLLLYRLQPGKTPTRPPTELVGAFLLIAGSVLLMASNSGTMLWLSQNKIDSMFLINLVVTVTAIALCYVSLLMTIKAWAQNRVSQKRVSPLAF